MASEASSTSSSRIAALQTIRPTGISPGALAGQRQRAAVEQVDRRDGLRSSMRVGGEEGVVAGEQRRQRRRDDRHGGAEQRVEAGACAASVRRDPVAPRRTSGRCSRPRSCVRRDGCAARRAGRSRPRVAASRRRCQAQLSAAEKPPAALQRGQLGQRGQGDLFDRARRPARSVASARSKARRHGRLQRVEHHASWAPPAAARDSGRLASAHAALRPAPRAAATASRTERVIAQTVSSVVDSGIAPVGRHQPRRVLEADQALAARPGCGSSRRCPSRAPPRRRRRPPTPRRRRSSRRGCAASASSVAVAALAGVPWCGLMPTPENANSLMLVRPIERRAGGAQARHGRAVAPRRARPWPARREPAAVDCAGHVEQVLHADGQAGQRRQRRAGARASTACAAARPGVEAADEGVAGRRRRGGCERCAPSSFGAVGEPLAMLARAGAQVVRPSWRAILFGFVSGGLAIRAG